MKKKFVPFIQRPCAQDWNAMPGDDKRPFCAGCQLHVHNLSAMTPAEQTALISGPAGRRCITYTDGKEALIVRTGLWIFLQRFLRPFRAVVALCAAVVPLLLTGCAGKPDANKISAVTIQPKGSCPLPAVAEEIPGYDPDDKNALPPVGGIMMEEPLWRRILFFLP